jgi:hypothetical protein
MPLLQQDCQGTANFKLVTNISYYRCILKLKTTAKLRFSPAKYHKKKQLLCYNFLIKDKNLQKYLQINKSKNPISAAIICLGYDSGSL